VPSKIKFRRTQYGGPCHEFKAAIEIKKDAAHAAPE